MKAYKGKRVNRDYEEHRIELFCAISLVAIFVLLVTITIVNFAVWAHDDNHGTSSNPTPPVIATDPTPTDTGVLVPDDDYDEQGKIYVALVESGYLRDDVPLSYELQDTLRTACDVYGVEYCLILGLIQCESNFDENAVSAVGCYGLMQLNPKYFPAGLNSHDNIMHGVEYFAKCLYNNNYNVAAALRAYNHGHDDGHRVYANTVLAYAEKWREGETYVCG